MDSEFPEGNKPEAINSIFCVGNEARVLDCRTVTEGSESCGQFEDAGIVCQGKLKLHYDAISKYHRMTYYRS